MGEAKNRKLAVLRGGLDPGPGAPAPASPRGVATELRVTATSGAVRLAIVQGGREQVGINFPPQMARALAKDLLDAAIKAEG